MSGGRGGVLESCIHSRPRRSCSYVSLSWRSSPGETLTRIAHPSRLTLWQRGHERSTEVTFAPESPTLHTLRSGDPNAAQSDGESLVGVTSSRPQARLRCGGAPSPLPWRQQGRAFPQPAEVASRRDRLRRRQRSVGDQAGESSRTGRGVSVRLVTFLPDAVMR